MMTASYSVRRLGEIDFKLFGEKGCANGARSLTKQPDDLSFHCCIHLDERRPWAFEAFAGEFLRRVDAEFAAVAISLVAER